MLISKSFLSPSLSFPRSVSRPITQPVWARAYNLNQCMNCKRLKNFGLKLRLLRFSLFISFIARSLCLSIAWQQQQQQLIRRAIRIFWAYKHTTMTICVAACVYVWANEKDWGKKKDITIKLSNSPTPSLGNKSKSNQAIFETLSTLKLKWKNWIRLKIECSKLSCNLIFATNIVVEFHSKVKWFAFHADLYGVQSLHQASHWSAVFWR